MCIRAGVISSSGLVLCPHTFKVSENQIAGSSVSEKTSSRQFVNRGTSPALYSFVVCGHGRGKERR